MTDTTPEAVERLARVLDEPFYRVEGYAGPYIDEATLRDEHTAAAATLRALSAEVSRLTAQGEPVAWGTGNALYVDDDPAPVQILGNPITLTYTNYRGETAQRTITPRRVWFGSTEWHPEPQWLLTAFDHEKQADRDFALRDFGSPAQTQPEDVGALREALTEMVGAVCGDTGFAACVRRDSGRAYPWEALEIAEAKARAALAKQGGVE